MACSVPLFDHLSKKLYIDVERLGVHAGIDLNNTCHCRCRTDALWEKDSKDRYQRPKITEFGQRRGGFWIAPCECHNNGFGRKDRRNVFCMQCIRELWRPPTVADGTATVEELLFEKDAKTGFMRQRVKPPYLHRVGDGGETHEVCFHCIAGKPKCVSGKARDKALSDCLHGLRVLRENQRKAASVVDVVVNVIPPPASSQSLAILPPPPMPQQFKIPFSMPPLFYPPHGHPFVHPHWNPFPLHMPPLLQPPPIFHPPQMPPLLQPPPRFQPPHMPPPPPKEVQRTAEVGTKRKKPERKNVRGNPTEESMEEIIKTMEQGKQWDIVSRHSMAMWKATGLGKLIAPSCDDHNNWPVLVVRLTSTTFDCSCDKKGTCIHIFAYKKLMADGLGPITSDREYDLVRAQGKKRKNGQDAIQVFKSFAVAEKRRDLWFSVGGVDHLRRKFVCIVDNPEKTGCLSFWCQCSPVKHTGHRGGCFHIRSLSNWNNRHEENVECGCIKESIRELSLVDLSEAVKEFEGYASSEFKDVAVMVCSECRVQDAGKVTECTHITVAQDWRCVPYAKQVKHMKVPHSCSTKPIEHRILISRQRQALRNWEGSTLRPPTPCQPPPCGGAWIYKEVPAKLMAVHCMAKVNAGYWTCGIGCKDGGHNIHYDGSEDGIFHGSRGALYTHQAMLSTMWSHVKGASLQQIWDTFENTHWHEMTTSISRDMFTSDTHAFMALTDRQMSPDHICPQCGIHPEVLIVDCIDEGCSNANNGIEEAHRQCHFSYPVPTQEKVTLNRPAFSAKCHDGDAKECDRKESEAEATMWFKILKDGDTRKLLMRWTQLDNIKKECSPAFKESGNEYQKMIDGLKKHSPCIAEFVEFIVGHRRGTILARDIKTALYRHGNNTQCYAKLLYSLGSWSPDHFLSTPEVRKIFLRTVLRLEISAEDMETLRTRCKFLADILSIEKDVVGRWEFPEEMQHLMWHIFKVSILTTNPFRAAEIVAKISEVKGEGNPSALLPSLTEFLESVTELLEREEPRSYAFKERDLERSKNVQRHMLHSPVHTEPLTALPRWYGCENGRSENEYGRSEVLGLKKCYSNQQAYKGPDGERQHKKVWSKGFFIACCPHLHIYLAGLLIEAESVRDIAAAFAIRYPRAPGTIVFDNACKLREWILRRPDMAHYFRNTVIKTDRWHGKTHNCGPQYKIDYGELTGVNTSAAEAVNSRLRRMENSIRNMSFNRLVRHVPWMADCWNEMRMKNLCRSNNVKTLAELRALPDYPSKMYKGTAAELIDPENDDENATPRLSLVAAH